MSVFNLSVRIIFALLAVALFALPTFAQVGYDVMPLAELQKKADASDVHALNELVYRFCYGVHGATKDKSQATQFAQKAIEKGSTLAKGFSYEVELGVAKDLKQARQHYLQAAEEGNAEGQQQIGNCYFYGGEWGEKKLPEAVKWYRKAAEQGYARAQNNLGSCYYFGVGVTKDYAEAVTWYRKAAEQGLAAAQNNLGSCYYFGVGVTKDDAEAVTWYRKAAEQGYATAQDSLGSCYYLGVGVTKDYAEAVTWYRKAAEQGYAIAQNNLGNCYDRGDGVTEDKAEAVKWFRKAAAEQEIERIAKLRAKAEQGDAAAQTDLGECCYTGKGFDGYKEYKEAVKWFRKAAEQGYTRAQMRLGDCYYEGRGVEKNIEEARKWFKKGGEPKDSIADYKAGMRFLELKEFKKAVKALKLAADKGHSDAHYQLHEIYEDCNRHKDGLAAQELDKNSDGKEDESGEMFYDLKETRLEKAAAVNHPESLCSLAWYIYVQNNDYDGKIKSRGLYIRGQELGCSFTNPRLEEILNIPARDPEVEAARQKAKEANRCTACNDNGKIYGVIGKSFLLQNPKYDSRTCPVCDGTKQKKSGRRLCGGCDGGGYTTSTSNYTETEYQGNGRSISYDRSSTSASKCGVCKGDGYLSN